MNAIPANRRFAYRDASLARLPIPGVVAGVLTIREGRGPDDPRARESRYALREDTDAGADTRRFRLTKPGGAERYYAALDADGSGICDCTGFLQYGTCKHILALAALARNGEI